MGKIFQPFKQLDGNITNGTGLGLVISKNLIEMYEGTISVESILNEGSVFSVFLPQENILVFKL